MKRRHGLLRGGQRGWLTLELLAAMAIFAAGVVPLALSEMQERRMARAYYYRAAAMTIVDGELEVLAAGGWQNFLLGAHPYVPRAESAAQLPPGDFTLNVEPRVLRLEWRPHQRGSGGHVVREVARP